MSRPQLALSLPPASPARRAWREPKMRLPQSPAAEFVGSPRFRLACERYGLKEKELVDPDSEPKGGLEAKLYARREKRRLHDLSAVLMERGRLVAAEAAARPQTAPRADAAAAPSDGGGEGEGAPSGARSGRPASAGPAVAQPGETQAALIAQMRASAAHEMESAKNRTRLEIMALVEEEQRAKIASEEADRREQAERDELLAKQAVLAKRRAAMLAEKRAANEKAEREAAEWEAMQVAIRAKRSQEDAARAMKRAARKAEWEAGSAKREAKRQAELRLVRSRSASQIDAKVRKVVVEGQQRERRMEVWRKEVDAQRMAKKASFAESRKRVAERMSRLTAEKREAQQKVLLATLERERADEERIREAEAERMRLIVAQASASKEKTAASAARLAAAKAMFEAENRMVMAKNARKEAASKEYAEERARELEVRRQISVYQASEKLASAERAMRASAHAHAEQAARSAALEAKAQAARDQRSKLEAKRAHVARDMALQRAQVKETMALSAGSSLGTLRKNTALLSSLGLSLNEIKQASAALYTSLSSPSLHRRSASRPGTASSSTASLMGLGSPGGKGSPGKGSPMGKGSPVGKGSPAKKANGKVEAAGAAAANGTAAAEAAS